MDPVRHPAPHLSDEVLRSGRGDWADEAQSDQSAEGPEAGAQQRARQFVAPDAGALSCG